MGSTVITFGTFDLFHVGHLRILERAAAYGERLIVGVSTDELNIRKKGSAPIIPFADRAAIVGALSVVTDVFPEESMEDKPQYIHEHGASVLVMGSDWSGKFDTLSGQCRVVYLERTPSISTTIVKAEICTLVAGVSPEGLDGVGLGDGRVGPRAVGPDSTPQDRA